MAFPFFQESNFSKNERWVTAICVFIATVLWIAADRTPATGVIHTQKSMLTDPSANDTLNAPLHLALKKHTDISGLTTSITEITADDVNWQRFFDDALNSGNYCTNTSAAFNDICLDCIGCDKDPGFAEKQLARVSGSHFLSLEGYSFGHPKGGHGVITPKVCQEIALAQQAALHSTAYYAMLTVPKVCPDQEEQKMCIVAIGEEQMDAYRRLARDDSDMIFYAASQTTAQAAGGTSQTGSYYANLASANLGVSVNTRTYDGVDCQLSNVATTIAMINVGTYPELFPGVSKKSGGNLRMAGKDHLEKCFCTLDSTASNGYTDCPDWLKNYTTAVPLPSDRGKERCAMMSMTPDGTFTNLQGLSDECNRYPTCKPKDAFSGKSDDRDTANECVPDCDKEDIKYTGSRKLTPFDGFCDTDPQPLGVPLSKECIYVGNFETTQPIEELNGGAITTADTSDIVTVTATLAKTYEVGDEIQFDSCTTESVNGIPSTDICKAHTVRSVATDGTTFTIKVDTTSASATSGGFSQGIKIQRTKIKGNRDSAKAPGVTDDASCNTQLGFASGATFTNPSDSTSGGTLKIGRCNYGSITAAQREAQCAAGKAGWIRVWASAAYANRAVGDNVFTMVPRFSDAANELHMCVNDPDNKAPADQKRSVPLTGDLYSTMDSFTVAGKSYEAFSCPPYTKPRPSPAGDMTYDMLRAKPDDDEICASIVLGSCDGHTSGLTSNVKCKWTTYMELGGLAECIQPIDPKNALARGSAPSQRRNRRAAAGAAGTNKITKADGEIATSRDQTVYDFASDYDICADSETGQNCDTVLQVQNLQSMCVHAITNHTKTSNVVTYTTQGVMALYSLQRNGADILDDLFGGMLDFLNSAMDQDYHHSSQESCNDKAATNHRDQQRAITYASELIDTFGYNAATFLYTHPNTAISSTADQLDPTGEHKPKVPPGLMKPQLSVYSNVQQREDGTCCKRHNGVYHAVWWFVVLTLISMVVILIWPGYATAAIFMFCSLAATTLMIILGVYLVQSEDSTHRCFAGTSMETNLYVPAYNNGTHANGGPHSTADSSFGAAMYLTFTAVAFYFIAFLIVTIRLGCSRSKGGATQPWSTLSDMNIF